MKKSAIQTATTLLSPDVSSDSDSDAVDLSEVQETAYRVDESAMTTDKSRNKVLKSSVKLVERN